MTLLGSPVVTDVVTLKPAEENVLAAAPIYCYFSPEENLKE
jgi:hypothetical protein